LARRFDIACIDFDHPSGAPMQERSHVAGGWATVTRLVACPSFVIEKVRMAEGARHPLARSELAVWIILEGTGTIEWDPDAEPSRFGPGKRHSATGPGASRSLCADRSRHPVA